MANYEFRKFVNATGFVATILIAVAILVAALVHWISTGVFGGGIPGLILGNGLPNILMFFANVCAYLVAIISGFYYARSKRSIWFVIAQSASTIIIAFVVISSLF